MEQKGTVLVVDDTHSALKLLTDILKAAGFQVRPADSGELALASAAESPPDLILLDINMPVLDGYEVCRRLKRDERLKEIPVIFISALSETIDKVKAFGVGGVDYVTKPFDAAEVEARVRTHLELRRQRQLLQANYLELSRLEALRDNLVHMVVHDMRSPLMAVSGSLEMLQPHLPVQDADAKGLLQLGLDGTAELITLCNAVLDVSRLETGLMPVNREPCELIALVSEAVAATKVQAAFRRVAVRVEGPSVCAWADRSLTYRVIVNLLTNAIKHSPENVVVRVMTHEEQGWARVEVIDVGAGIPPEYHKKIFEKFCLVDARQEGQKHSAGLGLTFCKLAVEAHGGKIGVESQVGQGSTFWFLLPLASQS
jgi:signal transduction histidine kinase